MNIYCKDELPTWHEMYYEFWSKKLFQFNPLIDNEMDLYWNTEHNRMILGFACNQLNKMINDSKEELLTFVRQLFDNYKIKNFYFILSNDIDINDDGIPCIYSLKIPSTKKFSIFSTEYKRKDLQEITQNIELKIIIVESSYDFKIIDTSQAEFIEILSKVINPIIEYFTEPIGWK